VEGVRLQVLPTPDTACADRIVVDAIGMLPIGPDAAKGFYRLVDAAHEKRSMAVSSNLHPAKAHTFETTCVR